MIQVAILNDKNHYFGIKEVEKASSDDVVLPEGCDLPTDGTYKYDFDKGQFIPLGFGLGPSKSKSPCSVEHVLFQVISALSKMDPDTVPQDAVEWQDWYSKNLKQRAEESKLRSKIIRRRSNTGT